MKSDWLLDSSLLYGRNEDSLLLPFIRALQNLVVLITVLARNRSERFG